MGLTPGQRLKNSGRTKSIYRASRTGKPRHRNLGLRSASNWILCSEYGRQCSMPGLASCNIDAGCPDHRSNSVSHCSSSHRGAVLVGIVHFG